MIPTMIFLKGDTFRLPAQRIDDETGNPVSLAGTTVHARIRMGGTAEPLAVTVTNEAAGEYLITASAAETADWVRGLWPLRVSYSGLDGAEPTRASDPVLLVDVREDF